MQNPNFLTINLILLLVTFITVYFLSFFLYPIMATNSLTTFQGPIYENSQIILLPILFQVHTVILLTMVLLLPLHNTNRDLISTEKYDKIKNCSPDTDKKPSSIEYLTFFNCGHIKSNITTVTEIIKQLGNLL